MNDLTPLEKEFFKELVGFDYDPTDGTLFTADIDNARLAAALCERKMREAIELARGKKDILNYQYTEQEIIDKLSNPK